MNSEQASKTNHFGDPPWRSEVAPSRDVDFDFLTGPRPPYESYHPQIAVADLFCGCGALTLGVAEAARSAGLGLRVALAIDNAKDASDAFQAAFPSACVKCGDVEDLFDGVPGSELTDREQHVREEVGAVDILLGGPPCQGHSDLNNHTRRNDLRNSLYGRMGRAAEVLEARIVLIENVPTVRHDVQNVVESTMEDLKKADFLVADEVLDLSLLGVPQRRRRHVVLALKNLGLQPASVLEKIASHSATPRTVGWATRDLLKANLKDAPSAMDESSPFDTASSCSEENRKRMKWLFDNDKYDLPNEHRPKCHQSQHSYVSMYGRLRLDLPAQTITTGYGSMGQGRFVHPLRQRTITPHEAARLQLLPDFMPLKNVVSRGSLARLIGNAVPPALSKAIMLSTLPPLRQSLGGDSSLSEGNHNEKKEDRAKHGRGSAGRIPASSPHASSRMRATRQRGTAPEVRVAEELARLDVKLREQATPGPLKGTRRKADFVAEEERVAVFIDGCFWHLCPIHRTYAKANADAWFEKLEANKRRDDDTNRRLIAAGWTVLRFWEHESPSDVASKIVQVVSEEIANNRGHER